MSTYLDMVDRPEHVKKLTLPQLQELAEEIRQELIAGLAKGGGHLGPNLGVVELTLALHKVFTTPKDKFVWDVEPSGLCPQNFDRAQRQISAPSARRTA